MKITLFLGPLDGAVVEMDRPPRELIFPDHDAWGVFPVQMGPVLYRRVRSDPATMWGEGDPVAPRRGHAYYMHDHLVRFEEVALDE